jgi:hypothetical protein
MKFIRTDKDNRVYCIDYLPEEGLEGGYYVDDVPEPTQKEGFVPVQYYTEARGFWTEYQEAPKSKEEREELLEQDVSALKNKLSEMQRAMAEMSMTIAMKGGVN